MLVTPEIAIGFVALLLTIIAGIIRSENRFTRMETLMEAQREENKRLSTVDSDHTNRITKLEQQVSHYTPHRGVETNTGG